MSRTVIALIGLAVLAAVFAGYYYAPRNAQVREEGAPAYHLGPGDVKSTQVQPTLKGTPILVSLRIVGPPIDVYVMDRHWAASLPDSGELDLSGPFSYRAEWSLLNVTGDHLLTIVSDGQTSYNLVFDHSDNFYEGDAAPPQAAPGQPEPVVSLQMTTRYQQEEGRSLLLAYLATVPSLLLVAFTVARKLRRRRRERAG